MNSMTGAVELLSTQLAFSYGWPDSCCSFDVRAELPTLEEFPSRREQGIKTILAVCGEEEMYSVVFIPEDEQKEIMELRVAFSPLR